jgi:hypothetical protein
MRYLQRYSWDSPCETDYEVRQEYKYRRQKSKQKKQAKDNKDLLARWKR